MSSAYFKVYKTPDCVMLQNHFNLKSFNYILTNILSYYILIMFVLVLMIFGFQAFRIMDLIVVSGASSLEIFNLIEQLFILTLPILLPTALLFSLFYGYNSLSKEKELLAFSAIGLSDLYILSPGILLTIVVFVFSYFCNTVLCPVAHKTSSVLENKIKEKIIKSGIKPGVFFDFQEYTIYVRKKKKKKYFDVFINSKKQKATIISKEATIEDNENEGGILFNLFNGVALFTRAEGLSNQISFDKFSIPILSKKNYSNIKLTNLNQTNKDIQKQIVFNKKINKDRSREIKLLKIELVKRFQMSVLPFVYFLMFYVFGFKVYQRMDKDIYFNFGIGFGVIYWILHFLFESIAIKNINSTYIFLTNLVVVFVCLFFKFRNKFLNAF